MYHTQGNENIEKNIIESIKQTQNNETNKVTLKEAFITDERYTRASWVAVLLVFFIILNGYVAVFMYANQLFTEFLGDDSFIKPRDAVYCLSATQFAASLVSFWTVNMFGRRTLLLFGHMSVALILSSIGFCVIFNWKVMLFILVNLNAFVCYISNATILGIYITEICTDIALGMGIVTLSLAIFVQCTTLFSFISFISPQGFFFFYSVLALCGFFFVLFFVGETQGLNEKEKKDQFLPGARYGRNLNAGEECSADRKLWSAVTKKAYALRQTEQTYQDEIAIGVT